MKLKAHGNTVIIRAVYDEKVGSIIIPDTDTNTRERNAGYHGEVIAVGPKYKYDINPGDCILYFRQEGRKIYVDGELLFVLQERAILAKMLK